MRFIQQTAISSIGHFVYISLQEEVTASVIGITSKGIFLETDGKNILYLTSNPHHGPLTINLAESIPLENVEIKQQVNLTQNSIELGAYLCVLDDKSQVWHPTSIHYDIHENGKILERIAELLACLQDNQTSNPFHNLLRLSSKEYIASTDIQSQLKHLLHHIPGYEPSVIWNEQELINLLGFGEGLTPSGDDFLCGLLCARFYMGLGQDTHAQQILTAVTSKTTTLSLNLLRCAAQGSMDERLLNTLRFLFEGTLSTKRIKEELLLYGSSSGLDSLAGFLTAIQLYSTHQG